MAKYCQLVRKAHQINTKDQRPPPVYANPRFGGAFPPTVANVIQIGNDKGKYPDGKIVSHPEASFEVCQKSDYVGSTEFIIKTIHASDPGTRWLVGTELT